MRTTAYSELLAHATMLCGLADPSGSELQSNTSLVLNRALARRLKQCWEMAYWPETLRSQLRYYRPVWAAGTYAAGTELYYAPTTLYYRAIDTTSALPTDATHWTESPVDFNPYVALTQSGQDEIGKIRFVGLDDPTEAVGPRGVPYLLTMNGIEPIGNVRVSSIYIYFQLPAPLLRGATYVATASYAAGARVYFTASSGEGDYYTCLAAANAAESPESTSAKWAAQAIPEFLRDPVAQYAAADYLRSSGNRELAPAEEAAADATLARAITSSGLGSPFLPRFRAA